MFLHEEICAQTWGDLVIIILNNQKVQKTRSQNPSKFYFSFAKVLQEFRERISLISWDCQLFIWIVEIVKGKINTEKINFTYMQYFLLHNSLIKLLFCKANNIIAEIQRVGKPFHPSKLQNSSAKFRGIPTKLLRKKKNKTYLGFGVSTICIYKRLILWTC